MKSKVIMCLMAVFTMLGMSSCGYERVDAGCEGIKVNLNKLRTQALTPMILKQQWIDKWNGDIPTVITGGNTSAFLDLSKISK